MWKFHEPIANAHPSQSRKSADCTLHARARDSAAVAGTGLEVSLSPSGFQWTKPRIDSWNRASDVHIANLINGQERTVEELKALMAEADTRFMVHNVVQLRTRRFCLGHHRGGLVWNPRSFHMLGLSSQRIFFSLR